MRTSSPIQNTYYFPVTDSSYPISRVFGISGIFVWVSSVGEMPKLFFFYEYHLRWLTVCLLVNVQNFCLYDLGYCFY